MPCETERIILVLKYRDGLVATLVLMKGDEHFCFVHFSIYILQLKGPKNNLITKKATSIEIDISNNPPIKIPVSCPRSPSELSK